MGPNGRRSIAYCNLRGPARPRALPNVPRIAYTAPGAAGLCAGRLQTPSPTLQGGGERCLAVKWLRDESRLKRSSDIRP